VLWPKLGGRISALSGKLTRVLERVDGDDVLIAPDGLVLGKRNANPLA
jgi:hypothetical protein